MKQQHDIIIVGAGSTGIGLAHQLKLKGLKPILLEEAEQIGMSWRSRHDQLCLNTHRHYSGLPGKPLPSSFDDFPSKSQFISFLQQCAEELKESIHLGIQVIKIIKHDNTWRLETSAGVYDAQHVIMATGTDKVAVTPAWKGLDSYKAEVLHAADFGDASRFAGKQVLLVGIGNSGVDVGNHLSRNNISKSWVSVRSGSHIVPQTMFGISAYQILMKIRWLPIVLQDLISKIHQSLTTR